MTVIQNDQLRVGITDSGMEISSVIHLADNREYIWQADPNVWGSQAPVLFPIVGGLKDGQYHFKGQNYTLPKHGFIRRNPNLRVVEQEENSITFELSSSPALKLIYPFDFTFRLTYLLKGNQLHQEHLILNESEDPMYFSLGGHPAFRVPHYEEESYNDYHLAFEYPESEASATVNDQGLIGPDTRPVPWQENQLPLNHQLFTQDALVFKKLQSRKVDLISKQHGKVLSVSYEDFDFLGIWAKPNGDFVCIEPWLGIADNHDTDGDFTHKEGILELGGLGAFGAAFIMEFY